jgi:hypothetical protein
MSQKWITPSPSETLLKVSPNLKLQQNQVKKKKIELKKKKQISI